MIAHRDPVVGTASSKRATGVHQPTDTTATAHVRWLTSSPSGAPPGVRHPPATAVTVICPYGNWEATAAVSTSSGRGTATTASTRIRERSPSGTRAGQRPGNELRPRTSLTARTAAFGLVLPVQVQRRGLSPRRRGTRCPAPLPQCNDPEPASATRALSDRACDASLYEPAAARHHDGLLLGAV